jgi:hypothetical protein
LLVKRSGWISDQASAADPGARHRLAKATAATRKARSVARRFNTPDNGIGHHLFGAGSFSASTNGFSDVGFLLANEHFWRTGADARAFQSFIPQTLSRFHLLVRTPLGTYNPAFPINPSANRGMISPTVTLS